MVPSKEERIAAKRPSNSNASFTPPEKKARIDAAESKIPEISDLPDSETCTKLVESGLRIWRKAVEDSESRDAENLLLKQKIEELESKVN